jgi:hypothetical protein
MSDQLERSEKEQIIREIARKHLQVEILDVRGRDALDFHDCHVAAIQNALEIAYNAGYTASDEEAK